MLDVITWRTMWIAFVNGLINEPHYIYNNGKYYNKHAIDKNILAKDPNCKRKDIRIKRTDTW